MYAALITSIGAFGVTYIVPTAYFLSVRDKLLAALAVQALDRERLRVTLVPSSRPGANRGDKVRVVETQNPAWYRAYLARRLHTYGARGSRRRRPRPAGNKRRKVRAALDLLAKGHASPHVRGTGWELLDLLREEDHHA